MGGDAKESPEKSPEKLAQTIIDQSFDVGDVEPVPPDLVATLRVVEGEDRGAMLRLDRSVSTVGRSSSCDLTVQDDRISGSHLTITFAAGEFRLRDNDSTNGTLLNGSPVKEFALRDGDQIRLGHTVLQMEIDFKME